MLQCCPGGLLSFNVILPLGYFVLGALKYINIIPF